MAETRQFKYPFKIICSYCNGQLDSPYAKACPHCEFDFEAEELRMGKMPFIAIIEGEMCIFTPQGYKFPHISESIMRQGVEDNNEDRALVEIRIPWELSKYYRFTRSILKVHNGEEIELYDAPAFQTGPDDYASCKFYASTVPPKGVELKSMVEGLDVINK